MTQYNDTIENLFTLSQSGNHIVTFAAVRVVRNGQGDMKYPDARPEYQFMVNFAEGYDNNGSRSYNFKECIRQKLSVKDIYGLAFTLEQYANAKNTQAYSKYTGGKTDGKVISVWVGSSQAKNNQPSEPVIMLSVKAGQKSLSIPMKLFDAYALSRQLMLACDRLTAMEMDRFMSAPKQTNNSTPAGRQFDNARQQGPSGGTQQPSAQHSPQHNPFGGQPQQTNPFGGQPQQANPFGGNQPHENPFGGHPQHEGELEQQFQEFSPFNV